MLTIWKSLMECFPCFLSATEDTPEEPPPNAFVCPVCGFLMQDPVAIPTGHSFHRFCIEACMEFNYIPALLLSSSSYSSISATDLPSFPLIPNLSLQEAILSWSDRGFGTPFPITRQDARFFVRRLMEGGDKDDVKIGVTTRERPSNASAGESSQSIATVDPQEQKILQDLMKPKIPVKITALDAVIDRATSKGREVSICTPRILAAVVPMLWSDHALIQTNASMAIKTFSQAPPNRIKIVACGAIPPLIHLLTNGIDTQAHINAASAICNLAEEEKNRMIIGVLGAVPPLVKKFCNGFSGGHFLSHIAQREAAKALEYLILCPHNLTILADTRTVPRLLEIAADASSSEAMELRTYAMRLLHNLAGEQKSGDDLIRGEAVDMMLRLLREGAAGMDILCLGVLHKICTNFPTRFKTLAMNAGADTVLAEPKRAWGEDGRQMARAMLEVIRKDDKKKTTVKERKEEEQSLQ